MSSPLNHTPAAGGGVDVRVIIGKVLQYWYLFAVCVPLALAIGFFYLKLATPMYQVEAQVLIKEEKSLGEDILFAELGLGKKSKNLENELLVMLSSPLMADVVSKKNLQYRYFREEGMVLREVYLSPPIRILDWTPTELRGRITGEVTVDEHGGYRFTVGNKVYQGEFGGQLVMPEGKLILWSDRSLPPGEGLIVMALSVEEMTGYFKDQLEVSIAGEESSTLVLTLKDASPDRAHDVLMGLIEAYNEHSVNEKNQGYEGAIRLINERLAMVAGELSEVEMDVEAFKRGTASVELSAEGSLLLTEMAGYDHKISDLEVQMSVMNTIEDVLQRSIDSREYVPTNLSINNVTLSNELQSYNALLVQRDQLERKLGPDHPDLQQLAKQIQNLRKSIIDNLQAIKSELELMLGASRQQQQILESRTRSLPRLERQLVEKERRKGVVENLYLYLLQKREESAISMAVTTSTGSVIEPATIPEVPVSPKGGQIWLISLFLGLALPSGVAMLLVHLNDKVEDEAAVARVTSVPILGSIGLSHHKDNRVVQEKGNSVVAEMFRLLRADLMYLTPGEELKTLMITSSSSGEGKSFITMNLAMTMAIGGRKVLVLELDLRKPKQEDYFGLPPVHAGIVNYLVDAGVKVDDIIQKSVMHPGLDVILSGPTPPNPGELILSKRLRSLMNELHRRYDLVILDTPPVGLVADALQLSDLPQATMYVVRVGRTRLPQLKVIEDIRSRGKLPKPFIVINGVRMEGAMTYGGYSYGYFAEEPAEKGPGTWLRGIARRFRPGARPA